MSIFFISWLVAVVWMEPEGGGWVIFLDFGVYTPSIDTAQ
jgi:hypothetical protein